jgi:hypothetical protein
MNKLLFVSLLAFLATGTANAGSATVFVPGNATGGFGQPPTGYVPLVPALDVSGKGTIKIVYKTGTVTDFRVLAGPRGYIGTLAAPNRAHFRKL